MKASFILRSLLILLTLQMVTGCKKEILNESLDRELLVAGRMSGTWAKPVDIVTPASVPAEIFGNMRLVFTVDEGGKPANFLAQDCPIVFSGLPSTWRITGTEDRASIQLEGVTPVDQMSVHIDGSILHVSFFMGWENTETGETGKGDFKVTLSRQ